VIESIRTDPARLDMDHWLPYYDHESSFVEHAPDEDRTADCGTVGCLAGWCVVLRRHTLVGRSFAGWIDIESIALYMFPDGVRRALGELFMKTTRYSDGPVTDRDEYDRRRLHDEDQPEESPLPPGVTILKKGTQAYVDDVVAELRAFQATHEADLRVHVYR
jgi:hypothetical protein